MTLLEPENQGRFDSEEAKEGRRQLEAAGLWRPGFALEPFDWLTRLAPPGALDRLHAFRLVDTEAAPPRGEGWRDWEPVLIDDEGILIGPSPELLRRILATAGFFDDPSEFGQQLLLQFHRFSLDFYDGYQVREQSFATRNGILTIEGEAARADRGGTFRTVASRTMVEFTASMNEVSGL